MIEDTPCVILSGGKSSRMREDIGIDKAYLDFWGEPLYKRQFDKLSKIFKNVYLSAKSASSFPLLQKSRIIEDLDSISGVSTQELYAPALGMLSAYEATKAQKIFFIGVDTPFISPATAIVLCSSKHTHTCASCKEKIHPTVGVYSSDICAELLLMIKENRHKLTLLLEKIGTIFIPFEDCNEFANLNRYTDYKKVIEDGINPFE